MNVICRISSTYLTYTDRHFKRGHKCCREGVVIVRCAAIDVVRSTALTRIRGTERCRAETVIGRYAEVQHMGRFRNHLDILWFCTVQSARSGHLTAQRKGELTMK